MPQGTGTPLVEARSLLSITTLASNPPAYPRNPTQKPLEQLVLYIVRVPGSKDVFLSPLKPPTKASVSPEALNASLYFLHVAGPDDDAVLESIEQERRLNAQNIQSDGNEHGHGDSAGDSKFAVLNRVQRKPVPGTTSGATTPNPETTPGATTPSLAKDSEYLRLQLPPRPSWQGYTPYHSGRHPDSEPGLRGSRTNADIPSHHSNLPSQPLPPAHAGQSRLPYHPGQPNRWSALPGSTSPLQPPVQLPQRIVDPTPGVRASWDGGRRPSLRPGSSGNLGTKDHPAPRDPRGDLKSKRSYDNPREAHYTMPRPFHVTLIRRDPTHGNQWNVGTITNSSRNCPSDVSADGGVAVEITTPGYKRFAGDNNAPLSLESLGLSSLSDLRNPTPPLPRPQTATDPSSTTKLSGPLKFERRVKLTNQYPHHRQQHSTHQRHRSHDTTGQHSSSKSPKGIYTFTSPWNGICTFTTGANGRSLKCRHAIPTTSSTTNSQDADGSTSVTVAELRFNLPTFGLGSAHPQRNDEKSGSGGDGGGSFFPPDPDRLDLSLARERAGGGMRGNSAKLGKLIIEDEGLKMLDLVVAACMGVWWKVYDHVQG